MSERDEFLHYMSFERQLGAATCTQYADMVDQWKRSGDDPRVYILDGEAVSSRKVRRAAMLCYHRFTGESFDDVPIRGRKRTEPLYVERDQVEQVLTWLRDNRDYSSYLVALFMYRTGARPAEACQLRLEDVNLTTQMASVIGKGEQQRFVPLRQDLVDSLRRWIGFIRPRRVGSRAANSNRLLIGPRGGILDERTSRGQTWRKDLYDAYTACGLGKPHSKPAHWLRHMFATHAAEVGMSLSELTYWMGHDDSATTMIYIHRAGLQKSRAKLKEADDAYFGRSESDDRKRPDKRLAFTDA